MKDSIKKRLRKLEESYQASKRPKVARVLCDPEVLHSLDFSHIEAEVLLILPDNGHRLPGDQEVPQGSYLVTYL